MSECIKEEAREGRRDGWMEGGEEEEDVEMREVFWGEMEIILLFLFTFWPHLHSSPLFFSFSFSFSFLLFLYHPRSSGRNIRVHCIFILVFVC